MFQVFLLHIFHCNVLESEKIMKCDPYSCGVLELDLKICLKMLSALNLTTKL